MFSKLISLAFTCLLGQRLSYTLCGTKVLFKESYERIAAGELFYRVRSLRGLRSVRGPRTLTRNVIDASAGLEYLLRTPVC